MNGEEIFERLRPLIVEVTGRKPEEVRLESILVEDLGAESIDLVDLSFLIEEAFGITLETNGIEKAARARIPGGVFEKDGLLTEPALEEMRRLLPEVEPARLVPGLRKADLPALLPVSVFVRLVLQKLEEKAGEAPCRT